MNTMALTITCPASERIIRPQSLSQEAFSTFGTVITNPSPSLIPSLQLKQLPQNAISANQGSAIKYEHVTHMRNLYPTAPSQVPEKAVMNMFVCAPRALSRYQNQNQAYPNNSTSEYFHINILERHPYTTQTFIPLGLEKSAQTHYLVIVAPSLPPASKDQHLPVPQTPIGSQNEERLPGRGLPDLERLKAFAVNGSQAVTYGVGVWHAPMVIIGDKPIDFVVVQFANGVSIEDCQEVIIGEEDGGRLLVEISEPKSLWKL